MRKTIFRISYRKFIYFLDILCAFRFCTSGCFFSIWIGECLKDERMDATTLPG